MNDFELDNMRQQMDTLKKKLEQQEIVNDRIIRHSMKRSANNITRRYYALIVFAILGIPYCYWAFVHLAGLSVAFGIGTAVFILVSAAATFYNSRRLKATDLMHNNLIDVRRTVASAKRFDNNWLFFGYPAAALWFAWFIYEVWRNDPDALEPLIFGGTVGAIVGLIIGLSIHFRTQHQYQEIIDQIEEVTETE